MCHSVNVSACADCKWDASTWVGVLGAYLVLWPSPVNQSPRMSGHWIDFGGCVRFDPPLHFVPRRDAVSNLYYIDDYCYSLYFIAIKRRAIASNSL